VDHWRIDTDTENPKYRVDQIWPGLTGNYGLKLWFKNGLKLRFKKISPGHI
jgi:hypothetical protein